MEYKEHTLCGWGLNLHIPVSFSFPTSSEDKAVAKCNASGGGALAEQLENPRRKGRKKAWESRFLRAPKADSFSAPLDPFHKCQAHNGFSLGCPAFRGTFLPPRALQGAPAVSMLLR